MPLVFDRGRMPERNGQFQSLDTGGIPHRSVEIALINNMPDAALEDTESQFFQLLEAAAGDLTIRIQLYSLPHLQRGEQALQHLKTFYGDIDDLWNQRLDGIIVTGTEPRQPNLRHEPYWPAMVDLLDWAEHKTISTILSCLAAHAGVLYSDGIERQHLHDKQFGVFEYQKVSDHDLTVGTPDLIRTPHSRWNEVPGDALISCGYSIVTGSADAGVDLFVKKKGRSLFVHFQGHPEYQANTLLKEYRRDIRRFFRHERDTYPSVPKGYFDAQATALLAQFRELALARPSEELLGHFPEAAVASILDRPWRPSAECIYRNWLQYLASRREDASDFAPAALTGTCSPKDPVHNGSPS
jgi:homoserine O-succinyltransferase/O-acetyltransferase